MPGLTISRRNTSRNILKNCVNSIIIRVLFVKIQDSGNNISQFKGLIIIFYRSKYHRKIGFYIFHQSQFPVLPIPVPVSFDKVLASSFFLTIFFIKYRPYSPASVIGSKCAP
jgi:hypothetical protein